MPELKEVFDMVTKQTEPEADSWREQEQRQRRFARNRRIGAISVAAAICLATVAVVLGTRADPNGTTPEPGVNPDATAAEEVATRFVQAIGAFDAEQAMTYLAEDADISELMTSVGAQGVEGTLEEFRLLISLLEAQRYRQGFDHCEETGTFSFGTDVRCTIDFHLFGSGGLGRDPYGGSAFDLTIRDGEIVGASMFFETDRFSPEMWEPFAEWVSANHPEDAAVMYEDETHSGVGLTEESVGLWRERIDEYVNGIASGGPLSAGQNSRVVEGVRFSFTVPDGWEAHGSTSINRDYVGSQGQGADAIVLWTSHPDGDDAQADDADPCESVLSSSIGSTAANLATAVSRAPGTELVAGPSDVTVGGYPAKRVIVTVREDLGCDPGYFYRWQAVYGGAFWLETTVGDTISVWIVDVDGKRLWFEAETNEQADSDLEQEIEHIVGSIRFD